MAKLIIYEEIEGAETVFEDFELSVNNILVGSGPDNHLVLDAPDIDSIHVSLELRHEHWILQDLGGPGGTLVNQNSIEGPYRLEHNDLIELGQIKLRFVDDEWDMAATEADTEEAQAEKKGSEAISGRIWFVTLAGGTIAVIFIILLLLIVADFLGVIEITDLVPWLK